MTTPLLFGKRRPVSAAAASQYVGTDTEIDQKGSDRGLKTSIRPLVQGAETAQRADGSGRS